MNNNGEAGNHDEVMIDEADVNDEEASASHGQAPVRDVVMEIELANELTGEWGMPWMTLTLMLAGNSKYLSSLESAPSA
jgi:hypothetical protein